MWGALATGLFLAEFAAQDGVSRISQIMIQAGSIANRNTATANTYGNHPITLLKAARQLPAGLSRTAPGVELEPEA